MRAWLAAILAACVALAGCGSDPDDENGPAPAPAPEYLAGPALWRDPQNAPHPAFGWATLSNPPAGDMPTWWQPVPAQPLPGSITGLQHVAQTDGIDSGAGTAVFGSMAFVPGSPSSIVDISDPAAPIVVATTEEGGHRGAAFIAYPGGQLVVAVSTGAGFDVIEVTDPASPRLLAQVEPSQRGHKLGVVPGTPIVYNAASRGGANVESDASAVTEIYDLTDPRSPVLVKEFPNGYSCHHIFFWNNAEQEKFRAICAGIEVTQLWDTADPRNPVVIVTIPVHHGVPGAPSTSDPFGLHFSHAAALSLDGNTLVVGDEMGGGGLPPGCVGGTGAVDGTPVSPSTPAGALWFYDVTDETQPLAQGWLSPGSHIATNPSQALASCTAHHGRIVPAEGRDLAAWAFYGAGVVLVDFTNPTAPAIVDQWNAGTNTWEVWYHNGYLFTGDLARGMDVLTFS